jgi:hypothetical protein
MLCCEFLSSQLPADFCACLSPARARIGCSCTDFEMRRFPIGLPKAKQRVTLLTPRWQTANKPTTSERPLVAANHPWEAHSPSGVQNICSTRKLVPSTLQVAITRHRLEVEQVSPTAGNREHVEASGVLFDIPGEMDRWRQYQRLYRHRSADPSEL